MLPPCFIADSIVTAERVGVGLNHTVSHLGTQELYYFPRIASKVKLVSTRGWREGKCLEDPRRGVQGPVLDVTHIPLPTPHWAGLSHTSLLR